MHQAPCQIWDSLPRQLYVRKLCAKDWTKSIAESVSEIHSRLLQLRVLPKDDLANLT